MEKALIPTKDGEKYVGEFKDTHERLALNIDDTKSQQVNADTTHALYIRSFEAPSFSNYKRKKFGTVHNLKRSNTSDWRRLLLWLGWGDNPAVTDIVNEINKIPRQNSQTTLKIYMDQHGNAMGGNDLNIRGKDMLSIIEAATTQGFTKICFSDSSCYGSLQHHSKNYHPSIPTISTIRTGIFIEC